MTTSMIKGNPLKLMLQFALPLLLGNLLQQTYNIIDAAIVAVDSVAYQAESRPHVTFVINSCGITGR